MTRDEDIIAYEVMGDCPVYKMNVREILEALGGKVKNNKIIFDLSNPIMELYPITVTDDGMGYGVDEEFITEVNYGDDFVTIFREKEDKDREKRLEEWRKEDEYLVQIQ